MFRAALLGVNYDDGVSALAIIMVRTVHVHVYMYVLGGGTLIYVTIM
jgi:hypothetical protein